MRENIIKDKSYAFALRVIGLYKQLIKNREFVISKQLLRSGTAIGALICESEFAQSRADFVNKMSVALNEANETAYWIQLLHDGSFLEEKEYKRILPGIKEIIAILVKIIKTAKGNL